jgi:hypothetical protein
VKIVEVNKYRDMFQSSSHSKSSLHVKIVYRIKNYTRKIFSEISYSVSVHNCEQDTVTGFTVVYFFRFLIAFQDGD